MLQLGFEIRLIANRFTAVISYCRAQTAPRPNGRAQMAPRPNGRALMAAPKRPRPNVPFRVYKLFACICTLPMFRFKDEGGIGIEFLEEGDGFPMPV